MLKLCACSLKKNQKKIGIRDRDLAEETLMFQGVQRCVLPESRLHPVSKGERLVV